MSAFGGKADIKSDGGGVVITLVQFQASVRLVGPAPRRHILLHGRHDLLAEGLASPKIRGASAKADPGVRPIREIAECGGRPQRSSTADRQFGRSADLEGAAGVLPRYSVRSRIARQ
jgi:hypothetical protein